MSDTSQGATFPQSPDDAAAEYVLGTLSAHEAGAVARQIGRDSNLALAVAEWERVLEPLTGLAPPESPPDGLWSRIEDRIARRPAVKVGRRWRPGLLLGGWAAAATAAAVVLALRIPAPPVMTVMLSDRTQAAWTASFGRDGAVRLAAVTPVSGAAVPVPEDRALQLWVLPPGAASPTSLGLLPRGERSATVPAAFVKPVGGMLIEITLEPQGGSPIGRPTGPVQFIGRLSQPGPNT